MHEQEVHVVGAELAEALEGGAQDILTGEVAGTDLGHEEDLPAFYSGVPNAPAYRFLVGVHLGRVHVPVA